MSDRKLIMDNSPGNPTPCSPVAAIVGPPIQLGPARYCTRCGLARDPGDGRCPDCRSPEFSLRPNEQTRAQ